MKPKLLSLIYLSAVPVLTAVLGFGVGHINYKIYLPILDPFQAGFSPGSLLINSNKA